MGHHNYGPLNSIKNLGEEWVFNQNTLDLTAPHKLGKTS